MALTAQQTDEVESEFKAVVRVAFDRLHGLNLTDSAVNPFLVLVTKSPRNLAEFLVWERLERSVVTSLGFRLQNVVRIVSTELYSSGIEEADLEGQNEELKRHQLMQLKLGPNTINQSNVKGIASALRRAETRMKQGGMKKGWVVEKLLGMCYGQAKHRSQFVLRLGETGVNVDNIGRVLWEKITGDPNAYKEVFAIAQGVATTFKNGQGKPLPDVIDEAIDTLAKEIDTIYGDGSGAIQWDRLIEDNM